MHKNEFPICPACGGRILKDFISGVGYFIKCQDCNFETLGTTDEERDKLWNDIAERQCDAQETLLEAIRAKSDDSVVQDTHGAKLWQDAWEASCRTVLALSDELKRVRKACLED